MEFSCIRTKSGFTEGLNISGAAFLEKFRAEEFWFKELRT
jgi:hypothetical protein